MKSMISISDQYKFQTVWEKTNSIYFLQEQDQSGKANVGVLLGSNYHLVKCYIIGQQDLSISFGHVLWQDICTLFSQ